jgi:two-component system sensor histidine kinase KdpD
MQRFLGGRAVGLFVALAAVAAITFLYSKIAQVNQTTVALTLLLAILAVSAVWGMVVSAFMSVVAVFAFNYFFLPPVGTLTIIDPQNWIALLAFLLTAILGSQLSARIRKEADEAHHRQHEVERLYKLSRVLLGEGNVIQLMNAIPNYIVENFEAGAAELFLPQKTKFYRSGFGAAHLDEERMKTAFLRDEMSLDLNSSLYFVPIRLGMRPIGSLGISGSQLSRQTLEAISSLVAIAIERARAVEQLGHAEAERQGERLKSALLDSITHDFRTPLTSIKAGVTSLLVQDNQLSPHNREVLQIVDEECDRLNHLVEEASEMARLEAGEVTLRTEALSVADIIQSAVEELSKVLGRRVVEKRIPENLPKVLGDFSRTKEVLVKLIDNAHQYSPRERPIVISAERSGDAVMISVADRGKGIDDFEQAMIFEKFYRGKDQRYLVRGSGMGLPIAKAIVGAQRGTISVTSQLGHGSVFSFTLPKAD